MDRLANGRIINWRLIGGHSTIATDLPAPNQFGVGNSGLLERNGCIGDGKRPLTLLTLYLILPQCHLSQSRMHAGRSRSVGRDT